MRSLRWTVAACFVLLSASPAAAATPEIKAAIGTKIDALSLADFRGKQHDLGEWRDSKLVVVAFLGCECPLAKIYAPRLNALATEFGPKGVAFVGVNSNRQDSITELAAYARIHNVEFPLLKDPGNQVADRFGATRTPQVFVLDADRKIRYAGRIDDQYGLTGGSGYAKPELTQRTLAEAIESLLAGNELAAAETPAPGCLIGRAHVVQANADVTYSNQIARIFKDRCVECHRSGQIAPFALTNYEEAAGWADMIGEVVSQRRMPPWHADPKYGHFSNDDRLSDDELQDISKWVAAGAPEGDRSQLPEPATYPEDWLMPWKPDMVVKMGDKPYAVSAEGTVDYQYFVTDPGFTEDKWIKVAECRAGNPAVVHHIIVFVRPPEGSTTGKSDEERDARGMNFLAGFAPGTRPIVLAPGMAKKIPAGSKLVFQLHYTPNGSPQEDMSMIGLKFVDPSEEIKYQVATTNAINVMFEIPPHADNHFVKATRKITRDTLVLSFFPHMHLRGKSFRYEVWWPDGRKEIVLDVPHYDFNWQNSFVLTEPLLLPKGSKVHCEAYFDNSENNLANPDPTQPVRWGDQTWEEMMIGWYDAAWPVAESSEPLKADKSKAEENGGR